MNDATTGDAPTVNYVDDDDVRKNNVDEGGTRTSSGMEEEEEDSRSRDVDDSNAGMERRLKVDLDRGVGANDAASPSPSPRRDAAPEEDEESIVDEASSTTTTTTTITNKDVVAARRKFKCFKKALEYIFTLPGAPQPEDIGDGKEANKMRPQIQRLLKTLASHQKKGRSGREDVENFLKEPFRFPPPGGKRAQKPSEKWNFDSIEELLTAHSTIDAELAKWAAGVERGFRDRQTEDAEKCRKVGEKAKEKKKELAEVKAEVQKQKKMYDQYAEEIQCDDALFQAKMVEYRELIADKKKDATRPRLMEETADIMQEVESIRKEKLRILLENDDFERENQDLRRSMTELMSRRFECRVDEYPGAELRSKTKETIGQLLRLGVPKEGINVVFESVLGLGGFKIEGAPTEEEIQKIRDEDDVT